MKIYTCTGDKGNTSLVGGTRVPKNHLRLDAYGTIDEVNAHLGLLLTYPLEENDLNLLQTAQSLLFTVGALLATEEGGTDLDASCVKQVEERIDAISNALPPLHAFVLPAGTAAACQAHVARTVVRRAERAMVALEQTVEVKPVALMYVNRLSDYLFVLARYLNINARMDEKKWKK